MPAREYPHSPVIVTPRAYHCATQVNILDSSGVIAAKYRPNIIYFRIFEGGISTDSRYPKYIRQTREGAH